MLRAAQFQLFGCSATRALLALLSEQAWRLGPPLLGDISAAGLFHLGVFRLVRCGHQLWFQPFGCLGSPLLASWFGGSALDRACLP